MQVYGFEFVMKNLVSSPFSKMIGGINTGFDSAEKKNKAFQKGIDDTSKLVNSLANKMRSLEVKRAITLDDKQLKRVDAQLAKIKAKHSELTKKTKPITVPTQKDEGSGGLMGLATNPYVMAGLAATYAVKQIIGAGGALSNKGYEYERNTFGITQYTGNQKTSEAYVDKISKTSTGKMFGSDAISGFQQAMMGFKDAQKSFDFVTKTLSNISAGTGNSIAELAGIQMKTRMQGYVQADEAQQWSERKIPLLDYLSKATGLNSSKLLKAIEQRQVKTDAFDKALTMMTSGKGIFANMTDKAAQTGFGQKSSFENGLDLKLQQAGNKFNEMFANRFYEAGNKFIAALETQEPKMKSAFDRLANQLSLANEPVSKLRDGLSTAEKAALGFASVLTSIANGASIAVKAWGAISDSVDKRNLMLDQAGDRRSLFYKQTMDNIKGFGASLGIGKSTKSGVELRAMHERERNDMAKNQQNQWKRFDADGKEKEYKGSQIQRASTHSDKANERRNIRKGLNPDGTPKTGNSPQTSTTGKGLGSASTTGGSIKNITLNFSSMVNKLEILNQSGKSLDFEEVKRVVHEELAATVASAVMMGSAN